MIKWIKLEDSLVIYMMIVGLLIARKAGIHMTKREEVIRYCKSFSNVYEDYPFHDDNWTVMRCRDSKKSFAAIYERNGFIWVNVKCSPEWTEFWRETFPSVIPAYHMNKKHWNSIILDETIPEKDIKRMIAESYDLVNIVKRKKVSYESNCN